jgi:hypothetical protein
MATGTAIITFKLAPGDFDGIIEMAGYGVGYWASSMESTDEGCHFTDSEGKKFFVTPEMMEQAALDLHIKSPLNDYYQSAIKLLVLGGDCSDVGSDIADAMVQQACFGKVVYG